MIYSFNRCNLSDNNFGDTFWIYPSSICPSFKKKDSRLMFFVDNIPPSMDDINIELIRSIRMVQNVWQQIIIYSTSPSTSIAKSITILLGHSVMLKMLESSNNIINRSSSGIDCYSRKIESCTRTRPIWLAQWSEKKIRIIVDHQIHTDLFRLLLKEIVRY